MWPKRVRKLILRKTKQDDKITISLVENNDLVLGFEKLDTADCAEIVTWIASAVEEMNGD